MLAESVQERESGRKEPEVKFNVMVKGCAEEFWTTHEVEAPSKEEACRLALEKAGDEIPATLATRLIVTGVYSLEGRSDDGL